MNVKNVTILAVKKVIITIILEVQNIKNQW